MNEIRAMPIEEVAAKLGIEVGRHKALCPFHQDRHPSLHFDIKRNRFKCFSCGASGGVIDIVMRYMNISFKDAVAWMTNGSIQFVEPKPQQTSYDKEKNEDVGVDTDYLNTLIKNPVINAEASHFLYEERKIDPRIVKWCGISSISQPTPCWRWGKAFYDAPSLLIPYWDVDGKLLSVQGRYMGKEDKPRFRFPRGSQVGMYNKPVIRRLKPGDELWIAEGPSDCWALLSAGHKAVAIPSATSLTKADISLLREGLPEGVSLHMYPDNDEPGMKLFEDLKRWFPQLKGHVLPEGCKDFGEAWRGGIRN
ncbi:MAG: CHC2 zinc finger domain-containing protein [Prevotella sp.]|nr:CHC2 zinc finger domain-containing protein [Prevotella sp.]